MRPPLTSRWRVALAPLGAGIVIGLLAGVAAPEAGAGRRRSGRSGARADR